MVDRIKSALIALAILSSSSMGAAGQADQAPTPGLFAPGAKGAVEDMDIEIILDRARKEGEALHDQNLSAPDLGWDAHGAAARNRGVNLEALKQAEDLLGLQSGAIEGAASERREGSELLVFVSFGMPETALRQLAFDARDAGATLLLQGFAQNSAPVMASEVARVFGENPEIAFAIDPTAFTRFGVKAVPTVIALSEPLTACKTRHCAGDLTPAHDRIAGNASLEYMLSALADEGEAGAFAAGVALDRMREGRVR